MDQSGSDIKAKAFKIIIVGPQAVGKSSILFRLSQSKFNTAYLSTVGIDFKTYSTIIDEKPYNLQIWDTAGQQKFRALTTTYYKGSQGCICVFDLSDQSTIDKCDYYLTRAHEQNIPKECVFLIGNKSDIEHGSAEKAKDLASKYQIQYLECSAKEGNGVVEIFNKLARCCVKSFGGQVGEEGSELKPQVNFREGRKGCCGK